MYNMMEIRKFNNILESYESQNLSFLLFENLDFTKDIKPKSFFRADFRRSKMRNCQFYHNIFGRADFVDVFVENTSFCDVNWGSCLFKNSKITYSTYTNNFYKGVSMQFNTFENCQFANEKFIINAYKCKFINCKFDNCTFEKSSLEDAYFENCYFHNVNIAECHAENLKFNACQINTLKLGVTYWSTYLFKYTRIDECTFMYKGQILDISNTSYFKEYMDKLLKQDRLYEFLNCIILNNRIYRNIISIFTYIIHHLMALPDYIKRKNLLDILDMLEFYYNYNAINYEEYNCILAQLEKVDWNVFDVEDANLYLSRIYKLSRTLDSCDFSLDYITTIDLNSLCEITIRLNYEEETVALNYIDKLFNTLNKCLNYIYSKPLYKKISVEKGSIVLTISSFLILGVLLSYTYKKISHNKESVKFERTLNESLQKRLANPELSISEIGKICSVAKEYNLIDSHLDEESIKNFSKELTSGEVLSIVLKQIV